MPVNVKTDFAVRGRSHEAAWQPPGKARGDPVLSWPPLVVQDPPMPHLTAIDLFSGAGGISLGLHAAGFDTLLANDWDAASACSYRRNLPETPFIEGDVREVSGRRALAKAKLAPRQLDL